MKLIRYTIIIFLFPILVFSQSNMKEASLFITKLDNEKKTERFLKISINKGKKNLQFKEIKYILFYSDSLKIINYKENKNGKIIKTSNLIIDKKIISKANLFFEKFDTFESKCVHKTSFGHHVYTKSTKFIKYAKNEWQITGCELNDENDYMYKFSNKVKLTRIDCLGLSKNLKSRRLYKQFLKDLKQK